jgi:hypothetical protein
MKYRAAIVRLLGGTLIDRVFSPIARVEEVLLYATPQVGSYLQVDVLSRAPDGPLKGQPLSPIPFARLGRDRGK